MHTTDLDVEATVVGVGAEVSGVTAVGIGAALLFGAVFANALSANGDEKGRLSAREAVVDVVGEDSFSCGLD